MSIVIIGAGPVGCYVAKILGEAGVKVDVYEKNAKENVKKNVGIIHFDQKDYSILGLPEPPKTHPCYIGTFETLWQVPLEESKKFAIDYPTDILYMNEFISYIAEQAEKTGNVRFHYNSAFETPVTEGSKVIGAKISGVSEIVRSDLLIDCTGMWAIVRNSLPDACGVPKLIARSERIFTLHMEHWRCKSEFPKGSNTYCCYKGFANQTDENQTLVGVSTLKGWDYTRKFHKEMIKAQKLDSIEHDVIQVLQGEVPYDFPPVTLVGDGFLSIGDSAFQNKPFNGEGMASGMYAARLALPVILNAIKNNDFSRKSLWAYNVTFFRGFGADFAMIRGTGETLVELTPEEFNWMFENGFIDKKMMETTWRTFKAKTGPKIIITTFKGFKRWSLFKRILAGIKLGTDLKRLYRSYPKNPNGLAEWADKFNDLIKTK
jgi:flavin-dependent dehydrogenase